jgi:transcriptional regulator with XRE-family HTH domain
VGTVREPLPVALAFGERVRHRRHARGWTIERLAEVAGLDWSYVASIERGQRNVSLVNIARLALALGIDAGTLMRGLQEHV